MLIGRKCIQSFHRYCFSTTNTARQIESPGDPVIYNNCIALKPTDKPFNPTHSEGQNP